MDPQLKQCQRNFSKWYQANRHKRYIPEVLRAEAVALLTNHSIEAVQKALGVPLSRLKRWRYEAKQAPVDFIDLSRVEALSPPPSVEARGSFECQVALENGMQLTLTGLPLESLGMLVRFLTKEDV